MSHDQPCHMIGEQIGRLGKSTIVYGVGGMLNRVLSLLLLPLLTYYLSPADYGISALLGLLSLVTVPVFSLGFGAAMGICYFEGNSPARKAETVWSSFAALVVSTMVLALLAFTTADWLSELLFGTPKYAYLVTITLLAACATILTQPFSQYLQFEQRALTFVVLTGISAAVTAALTLGLVAGLRWGVRGFVEATCLGQLAGLIFFLLPTSLLPTRWRLSFHLSSRVVAELLRLGLPLMPSFLFLFVIQQANRYILQWFDGLDSVGVYAVGFNLGMAMSLLVSGFQNAWYPFFMSYIQKQDVATLLFGRIVTYYVFGFGAISLLFYIVARPVILMITQVAFHDAYKVVGPAASAQFFSGVFILLLPGMYFAKDVRNVALIQMVAAIVAIGLNLWLIPALGLLGAAVGLALGAVSLAGIQTAWNWWRRRMYLHVRYETTRVAWFFAAYLAIAVVTLLDRDLTLASEVTLAGGLIILLTGIIYTLLSPNERATLTGMLSQLRAGHRPSAPITIETKD